jgi:uncharacterized protein (DUF2141 family)
MDTREVSVTSRLARTYYWTDGPRIDRNWGQGMILRMFAGWRARGLAALLVVGSSGQAPAQAQTENLIHVEISGLRSDKGQVLCALFSSAEAFPKKADKAVARLTAKIAERQAVCDFTGVAPGTYAVSVVHDENSNGKLDTNFIGMPREGVGASNDAKGHMGPPKFSAASFRYESGRIDLKIHVNYL